MKIRKFNDKILESQQILNPGYYVALNTFSISPGGGWRIGFNKGSILNYDDNMKMLSYNPLKKEWVNKTPPIQGTNNLNFGAYGGGVGMIDTFLSNTELISVKKAHELIKSAAVEETLTARQAISKLQKLPPNQKVKITY